MEPLSPEIRAKIERLCARKRERLAKREAEKRKATQ